MQASYRRLWLRAARLIAVIALLAWVAGKVHWRDFAGPDEAGQVGIRPGLASSLRSAHPAWLLAALGSSLISLAVVALRWRRLLRVQNVELEAAEAIRLGFLAEFFNTVIPGMVSGDAVKAYYVVRRTQRTAGVLASVLMDRALGAGGMLLCALAALLAVRAWGRLPAEALRLATLSVAALALGAGGALALLASPGLRRALRLDRLHTRLPFAGRMESLRAALIRYRRGEGLAAAGGLTAAAQLLGISSVALIGFGLPLGVPWYAYLLYVPLATMIAALPITPGGLGVMEGLYLLFFRAAGNPSAVAALVVLVRAVQLCGALPGAVILALSSERIAAETIRQTMAGEAANRQ